MWGQTLPELFHRGGVVMWPLLALSVLALAIVLERGVALLAVRLRFARFRDQLEPLVRSRRLAEAAASAGRYARSPVARVAAAYLARVNMDSDIRQEAVAREGSEQLVRLGKRLGTLSVIGQLAPMLGLLGTVTGLVTAFWQIEVKAGQVQPSDLAAGIWEALLTTVFGLVIAIPAIAAYHWFDQRLAACELEMQWIVAHFDEWLNQKTPHRPESSASTDTPARRHEPRAITVGAS